MRKRIKAVICVLSTFLVLAGGAYVNDYYRASEGALEALEEAMYLKEDILVFEPEESECGLIFYPGGKVQYEAYAPLMEACAEEGILGVLIHMPCNLAVLDANAAEGIQEYFPEIEKWYIAGHSLGGSMAASYAADNTMELDGLILLAAYSTENLRETGLDVLSVYGTEDHVLNEEKYEEYRINLPEQFTETILDGGCHAYFGDYGEQEGDGEASITREEQQKITVEAIKNFVK